MALATLPAYAKVRELRLCVTMPDDALELPAHLKMVAGTPYREIWAGEVVFADMLRDNAKAFSAWMAGLDGRVTAFSMQLTAGKFSRAFAGEAELSTAPVAGADRVHLNLTAPLYRGTRITVGDIESGPYQLFDVLQTVAAGFDVPVLVAPRVREAFTGGEGVDCGSVNGKFRLRGDDLAVAIKLDRGMSSLSIEEALD